MDLEAVKELLSAVTLAPTDGREAADIAGELEQVARIVDSLRIELVDSVERSGFHVTDGHRSVRQWVAYTCRTSFAEAARRVAAAETIRTLPSVGDAYREGTLGTEQLRLLSRAHRNRRCRDQLPDSEDLLLRDAQTLACDEFALCVDRWVSLADQEGVKQRHDSQHQDRHVSITEQFDGGFHIKGSLGPVQGAIIKNVFDRFVEAERTADIESARVGREPNATITKADLPRTESQRRADALFAAILQAAESAPGAQKPEPLVYIVMSNDAFEAALAELNGETAVFDPRNYRTWKCETLGGTQLTPTEALQAALAGRIRRVVLNLPEASVSKAGRLFTGPLRELLNVLDIHCTWLGCRIPWKHCQGDHVRPHRDDGPTSVSNGGLKCPAHNRLKENGYRTWRDPAGIWHTFRPDGTEITPAA